jgi:hypothetical protein
MNLSRMMDKERGRRIRTEIRDVLMREWDPIGVKDEPMAADEYDMYLGDIYSLLADGAPETFIASHLRNIEIKRMGFADFQTPDRLEVAKALKAISLN